MTRVMRSAAAGSITFGIKGTSPRATKRRDLLMVLPGCLGVTMLAFVVVSNTLSAPMYDVNVRTAAETEHRHPFLRPYQLITQQRVAQRQQSRSLFSTESDALSKDPQLLVFGTSTTYGAGLGDAAVHIAYPFQLSPTAHNAATPSGGFTLAAACTQSIVRDNVYDVIVLEFQTWEPALSVLAQRLRQRFPSALIIFLRLWHPSQLKYHQPNGTVIDFHTFRQVLHGNKSTEDPELYLQILATKERWSFDKPRDESLVVDEAVKVSASYFAMNIPDNDLFEYPKTMMDQLAIFQDASDNLNEQGHTVVAASLRSIIRKQKFIAGGPQKLGTWGLGDECHLWYENGLFEKPSDAKRLRRVEFAHANHGGGSEWFLGTDHYHALEVDDWAGGTLKVHNPFAQERMLYLTYLTTYGDQDARDNLEDDKERYRGFSELRIRINQKPAILIQAMHSSRGAEGQELARTSAVGMVPPGSSLVHLDPLIKAHKPSRAFKLLGWSILSSQVEEQDLSLEFSLEQTRVPPPSSFGSYFWSWFV